MFLHGLGRCGYAIAITSTWWIQDPYFTPGVVRFSDVDHGESRTQTFAALDNRLEKPRQMRGKVVLCARFSPLDGWFLLHVSGFIRQQSPWRR